MTSSKRRVTVSISSRLHRSASSSGGRASSAYSRSAPRFTTKSPLGPALLHYHDYDQLIEESLRRWQPAHPFQAFINRQPFEEADIVQARAIDFIFKPHGDVGDIGNIA